jgi:ubiquinone/menaquinone biosynthesis C-methylase UbiE
VGASSAIADPRRRELDKAAVYHRVRFGYDARRARVWRAVCAYLQPFIDENAPLLELGAGYGEFSRFARASAKWAVDLNHELTAYWPPEVRPLTQSALSPLPLEDASVATIFASNFFEHFTQAEIETILSEVRRVAQPGARLVVVQPNFRLEPRRYFDDYTHKSIFTDTGFGDFLRSQGWKILRQEGRFLPFSLKSRLPVCSPLVALYLALPFRPLAGQFLVVAQAPGG